MSFFKKLRLRQIVTVVLAGLLLVVSTACNAGNVQGARPQNPPVQVGGNNNPHKGGDGYTNYKVTTDPSANRKSANAQRNHADLQLLSSQLIAANIDSNASDLLYPGSNATDTQNPAIGTRGQQELLEDTQQFPKQRQTVIDRSNPNVKILERVGEEVKDASSFLQDTLDSAYDRPEMQPNPAVKR